MRGKGGKQLKDGEGANEEWDCCKWLGSFFTVVTERSPFFFFHLIITNGTDVGGGEWGANNSIQYFHSAIFLTVKWIPWRNGRFGVSHFFPLLCFFFPMYYFQAALPSTITRWREAQLSWTCDSSGEKTQVCTEGELDAMEWRRTRVCKKSAAELMLHPGKCVGSGENGKKFTRRLQQKHTVIVIVWSTVTLMHLQQRVATTVAV